MHQKNATKTLWIGNDTAKTNLYHPLYTLRAPISHTNEESLQPVKNQLSLKIFSHHMFFLKNKERKQHSSMLLYAKLTLPNTLNRFIPRSHTTLNNHSSKNHFSKNTPHGRIKRFFSQKVTKGKIYPPKTFFINCVLNATNILRIS
ncbi:hypothetical protein ME7_00827 [Bartonella birtlesii LL-WM9]|uniref:Uncharacterized protein n=1 Tax=Bartonella birtlesii LL-WM9 TaxID=1094552 RepID=J1IZ92_9HYPH|nr:hypothetical protein ME7_00827 [Bartonella birtlesii LL-WM9]